MNLSILEDDVWGARLRLPSWAGYQSRLGDYGAKDRPGPSDGSVSQVFAPEGRGIEPLSDAERRLVAWFERNEPAVSAAVKAALLAWCAPDARDRAERFGFDETFPPIATEADLRRNIGLHTIYLNPLTADGVPYLGYEFGCEWDEDHGAGVLMHGTTPVEVGLADVASLLWKAEAHAETLH